LEPDKNNIPNDEIDFESSTVFSKPNIEDKPIRAKKNGGFLIRIILAPVIIAALIIGVLLFNKYFGESGKLSSGEISSGETQSKAVVVTAYESDEIKSLSVKNESGKLEFYPDESGSDEEETSKWYIKGVPEKNTDTEATELTVSDCARFIALIERDFDSTIDYGFDNPIAEIVVTPKKGEPYELTLGKPFLLGSAEGAYAKISLYPDKVYAIDGTIAEYYTQSRLNYISPFLSTAIEENDDNTDYFGEGLEAFDYISFSGDIAKADFRFEMYGRENSSNKYLMTSPSKRFADETQISTMLSVVEQDLEGTGVYYYDEKGISDKALKEFGFADSSTSLEYKVGKDVVGLKICQSAKDEKYYAAILEGTPIIYQLPKRSVEFLGFDEVTFTSGSILLENISGIETAEFTIDGKKYAFNIEHKSEENDEGEKEVVTTVKYDGKTIDYEIFSKYYYYALAVGPYVSTTSLLDKRPEGAEEYVKVTLKHNDTVKDPDTTMTIFKLPDNDLRYYIELDGMSMGLGDKKYADMLQSAIKKVITNQDIEDAAA